MINYLNGRREILIKRLKEVMTWEGAIAHIAALKEVDYAIDTLENLANDET